ncbi:MAG TPA: hypothetical protein VKU60_01235 [Chloroflexota bacterium]|nr:hypothetical protein [Chloroflexota bacterium]
MLTWGEFKRIVDRQLAEGNGDDELIKCVEWNGLDEPEVNFQVDRHAGGAVMYVLVA